MKRKFLAVLMILVLAISVLPLSASAAAVCEVTGGAHDFAWGMSTSCMACGFEAPDNCDEGHTFYSAFNPVMGPHHACIVCGLTEEHADSTSDCVCDVCGWENMHSYMIESNETQHWANCSGCGLEMLPLSDHKDTDGVAGCDVCNYGCTHAGELEWNSNYWGHQAFCTDCWNEVVVWVENNHTIEIEAGKCTICGFTPCADHVFSTEEGNEHQCTICYFLSDCVDEDNDCLCDICGIEVHWMFHEFVLEVTETHHLYVCNGCGSEFEKGEHVDEDGKLGCDVCGYGCDHVEPEWSYNHKLHVKYCPHCGFELTEVEAHTMVDGECSLCGYAPCPNDEHTFGTEGWSIHFCEACGYYTDCVDEDANCICDVCETETHDYIFEKAEEYHTASCANCDIGGFEEPHYDYDKDGKCDACNYRMDGKGPYDNIQKAGDISIIMMGISFSLACSAAFVAKKKH